MSHSAEIESLAAELHRNAIAISLYCEQSNIPHKSLKSVTPATLIPDDAPASLQAAKERIKEAALRLTQLASDPREFLNSFQVEYQQLACLRWLCHFKIPEQVPLSTSMSYEAVAAATKVPVRQLKSAARMAITRNFLQEPEPGQLAHSSISAAFVNVPSFNDWAVFMASTSAMVATNLVEATQKYGETKSKCETAYNVWQHTDLPFFDHLQLDQERTRQFASYMKNVTSAKGTSIEHLLTGYDWDSLGNATVIDLGGSNGHASIALARHFPNLQFIVQDLAETIEKSRPNMDSFDLKDRITYEGHNFFTPEPRQNVDAFLLRMIIHDWPDAESIEILRNIAGSLKPGGRIIIMDTVLPAPGSGPRSVEAALRVRDLAMLETHNSKERELEEWEALLKAADSRLQLRSTHQPSGSMMSVLEVVRDDSVSTNGHS
ncbi:hypothetical protein M409DRAFT_38028 [Zasmidium cellare ATCC 36951]|uniref:O-methyltransferase C-terminal domain-containing protein n=1 Tax=Zasmidium cellare ATCC 36951 TaxID=1080233 RepID=A0A6A6BY43_ZASCE|nr:uncharacterized protein M409DRAFT_38028 [Zasmidium cellare ATCC 36951]KAF2158988.1 hypothetical protein M409DRAFT_38028 [Zasmidium cellare ATCC 36951]